MANSDFVIEELRIEACAKTLLIHLSCYLLSKPVSCSQAFCSSSIRKRRICPSLCVAASSLTRIHSHRRQLVASTSAMSFLTSLSSIDIFSKPDEKRSVTRVQLTCSPRQRLPSRLPPVVQVPSGFLAIAGLATLLRSVSSPHWRSPAALSITGVWAVSSTLIQKPPKLCPAVLLQAEIVEAYTFLQVIALSRSPYACTAGGFLHTGAIFKALSAGGVSGSELYSSALCRPVASQASYRRVALRPSKAQLSFSNLT